VLVLCIAILCLECFHCYVIIIDCLLTLISCTFQPMVALINHLLTYSLTVIALGILFNDSALYKCSINNNKIIIIAVVSSIVQKLYVALVYLCKKLPSLWLVLNVN